MKDIDKVTVYKSLRIIAALSLVLIIGCVALYNIKLNKYEKTYESLSQQADDTQMEEQKFIINSEGNAIFGTDALLTANAGSVVAPVPAQVTNLTAGTYTTPVATTVANLATAPVTVTAPQVITPEQALQIWQSYLTAPWKNPNLVTMATANPDIYSWVSVKGTVINYPILQNAIDDEWYLNHNLDGKTGYPGCLYTQRVNTKTFQDVLTVVYGHNMKNGTMFGGLKNYANKKYFDEHNEIYVETPTEKIIYDVICAGRTDDTNLFVKFRMTEAVSVKKLILSLATQKDTVYKPAMVDNIAENDKFIALSTCRSIDKNGRYVVIAKRRILPPLSNAEQ